MSVLVAAGIAVYESPQFRRWMNQSRRKIAVALYSLGDEIHPREPLSQDISMTEETSEEAEERRRKAREEITLRRELMHSRKDAQSTRGATSFDTLVDKDGRLWSEKGESSHTADENDDNATAKSTALDIGRSTLLYKRGGSHEPEALTNASLQAQREMTEVEAVQRDRLHLELPSETSSHHPSESLIDLTPTSEFPEINQAAASSPQDRTVNFENGSVASLPSSTLNSDTDQSDYFYAHPNPSDRSSTEMNTLPSDPFQDHEVSTTPSVAGSLEHIHDEISSDGTLSEWGQATDGVLTPASWSEVGSVISSDEEHHHQ